jgi:FixJ family two-component response regulator
MGASAYLTKPFSSSHLIETIYREVKEHPSESFG